MNEPCFYISFDSDEWYIYNKRPEWSKTSEKFTYDSSEGIVGEGIGKKGITEQLKEVLGIQMICYIKYLNLEFTLFRENMKIFLLK